MKKEEEMRIMITGAAGGLGSACVKSLLSRGAEILAVSRSAEGLKKLKTECEEKFHKTIETVDLDFSASDFPKILTEIVRQYEGGLDCLINNAGVLINKAYENMSDAEMEQQVAINFLVPAVLIREILPFMGKGDERSHIVNIGSMGGFQGSTKFSGLAVYSASKAALAGLTECLAAEYKESNVSFNCLALGSADTAMLRKAFPGYKSPLTPERLSEFIAEFALTGHRFFNGKVLPVAGMAT